MRSTHRDRMQTHYSDTQKYSTHESSLRDRMRTHCSDTQKYSTLEVNPQRQNEDPLFRHTKIQHT